MSKFLGLQGLGNQVEERAFGSWKKSRSFGGLKLTFGCLGVLSLWLSPSQICCHNMVTGWLPTVHKANFSVAQINHREKIGPFLL